LTVGREEGGRSDELGEPLGEDEGSSEGLDEGRVVGRKESICDGDAVGPGDRGLAHVSC
jgi:hypothetical protein